MFKSRLLRSFSVVSLFTLLSRVLGFVRDLILAMIFGAGLGFDAFVIAFRLPNFMRRLFAEGAFSQAFVPILAEYKEQQTESEVVQFIARIQGSLLVCLLFVVALGEIFAPVLVAIFAPGFLSDPVRFSTTVELLRITFPYLFLIAWVALLAAVYNTWRRFAIPAATPIFLNIALIAAALGSAHWSSRPVLVLASGVILGGVLQLLWQFPMLLKMRLLVWPRFVWKDKGVIRVLKLMVPALFGVSVAQMSLLIDSVFASFLPAGSLSWLYFADRFTFFPLGVIGVAISTVILPRLSSLSARKNVETASITLNWALRLVLLLGVPAAVGLAMLAGPILATLIQHGAFTAHDVVMTQMAVIAFSVGLPSFMLVKVLASAYYAKQNMKTPVKIASIALAVNILLNLLLVHRFHHVGLALATALASWVNSILLLLYLKKREGYVISADWLKWIGRLVVPTIAMAGVLYCLSEPLAVWVAWSVFTKITHLIFLLVVGMASYVFVWYILGLRFSHLTLQEDEQ